MQIQPPYNPEIVQQNEILMQNNAGAIVQAGIDKFIVTYDRYDTDYECLVHIGTGKQYHYSHIGFLLIVVGEL